MWDKLKSAFADEVLLDYTSMTGGQPSTSKTFDNLFAGKLSPDTFIASWKDLLPGFKMTQHAITNHTVTLRENGADCFSYVTAIHHLPVEKGDNYWTVHGFYDHHLVRSASGWKVDAMKFTVRFIQGNSDLPKLAAEAVKASSKQ